MKICVIGAGASGLMAAGIAASRGADVTLLEKNEKAGKKIYITGKGRCNLTNDCDNDEFISNVVDGGKFLLSAINAFSTADCMDFFQKNGLNLTVERGNRVFPSSNKASDVTKTLVGFAERNGAKIVYNTAVKSVSECGGVFTVRTDSSSENFDKVVVATGGLSYPLTGSTGDGYKFAKAFGHSLIPQVPSLVSLTVKESYVKELQGLALKNISAAAYVGDKQVGSEFGELLFTDRGLSGPVILSLSSKVNRAEGKSVKIVIDLKPALSEEQLDNRLLHDFSDGLNKQYKNALTELLPKSLIPVFIKLSGVNPEQKVNQISRETRKKLVILHKNLEFVVTTVGGFSEAVITAGGVNLKEINPKTMESKLIKNLYFCGEVLDVDALTGGFNLQIAFSTGYLAGINCSLI